MGLQAIRRWICPPIFLLAGGALSGCNEAQPTPSAEASASKPPQVSVVTVQPSPLPYVRELPGRISALRVAEIRARVAGIVVERTFRQGTDVKAGDILYRLDPAPFRVELEAAEAALAKAKAVQDQAEHQAKRAELLFGQKVASQAQHENAIASWRQAQADVAARQADVERAKLNLDYTVVRSPIDGRIGGALVTEGALVGQGEATHLATVQQLDPIYADFTQSVTELQQLRRNLETGALDKVAPEAAKAKVILGDGANYPHPGKLLFSDASVDPGTGQVTLRGEFPNPNHELLPGMYVRVRIVQGVDDDALAVPQQAVQFDAGGDTQVCKCMWWGPTITRPSAKSASDIWSISAGSSWMASNPASELLSRDSRNSMKETSSIRCNGKTRERVRWHSTRRVPANTEGRVGCPASSLPDRSSRRWSHCSSVWAVY